MPGHTYKQYFAGVNNIRLAADGSALPSPRLLSANTAVDSHSVYDDYTLFVMQWGQFLDHDLTHTPISKGKHDYTLFVM